MNNMEWNRYEQDSQKQPSDFSEFLVYHYHCPDHWDIECCSNWMGGNIVDVIQGNDEAKKNDLVRLMCFAFNEWVDIGMTSCVKETIERASTATRSKYGDVFFGGDDEYEFFESLGEKADGSYLIGMWHAYECGYSVEEIISNCMEVRSRFRLTDAMPFLPSKLKLYERYDFVY